MNLAWQNLRILSSITLLRVNCLVSSGSVKIVGPKCEGEFDGSKVKCGSTIKTDSENDEFKLGSLCENDKALKLRILRDDTDIEGNIFVSRCFISIFNFIIYNYTYFFE